MYEFKINIKPSTQTAQNAFTEVKSLNAIQKKPRKPRAKEVDIDGVEVTGRADEDENTPLVQTNVPYIVSFNETNKMLKDYIKNVEVVEAEIAEDVRTIRDSKTMKSKYTYLANLQSARGTIMSQKLNAIKELNSVITKSHDLDAKRDKEFRASHLNQQDDNAAISKMYDAFVSTPVGKLDGQLINPLTVGTQELTLFNPNGMVASLMGIQGGTGLDSYVNNMSEETAIMMAEDNPAIEEVVMYNPSNGQMKFAYYDNNSGQEVTSVKAKDMNMFAEELKFDFDLGVASHRGLGQSFNIKYDSTLGMQFTPNDVGVTETVDNNEMKGF